MKGGHQSEVGDGPSTVSESMASNTKLSEFFGVLTELRGESSLSSYQPILGLLKKRTYRVFVAQSSPSMPQNLVSSLFQSSALETVFRPAPMKQLIVLVTFTTTALALALFHHCFEALNQKTLIPTKSEVLQACLMSHGNMQSGHSLPWQATTCNQPQDTSAR